MSDSVKKYFEDMSEHEQMAREKAVSQELEVRKYLWVLDFEMGRVSVSYTHLTLPTSDLV